mgnify:CR=1 FL=1
MTVRGFEWCNKAANSGSANAQYELCRRYLDGKDCKRDEKKAYKWCLMAAQHGNVCAQRNLAWMYTTGRGCKRIRRGRLDGTIKLHRKLVCMHRMIWGGCS